MEIEYDKEANALYIEFKSGNVAKTEEVDEDPFIDYFEDKTVLFKQKNPHSHVGFHKSLAYGYLLKTFRS